MGASKRRTTQIPPLPWPMTAAAAPNLFASAIELRRVPPPRLLEPRPQEGL